MAREPAGMATRSATFTSRVTRASTRSSTRAVSLVTVVSLCRPITESRETTSSSNVCCGGGGGAGASATRSTVSVRAGDAATCSGAGVVGAAGAGVTGRDAAGALAILLGWTAAFDGAAGVLVLGAGRAGSTTVSVSWTGFSVATAGPDAEVDDVVAAGAVADTGALSGAVVWRIAK